ncbi:MAG: hypothetical protein NXI32_26120 [bacterium]|nr:hypothetical protein [bacterium]
MNEPAPNSDVSSLDWGRAIPIVALGALLIFGGYSYFSFQARVYDAQSALAEQTLANQKLENDYANMQSTLAELKTAKLYEQQEQSISKANALAIIDQGQQIQNQLTQLTNQQSILAARLAELQNNEAGKKIASVPNLLNQVLALSSLTLPTSQSIATTKKQLETLLSAPRKAVDENVAGYLPSDVLITTLRQIQNDVATQLSVVEQYSNDLDEIASQAEAAGAVGTTTLAAAIEQHQLEEQAYRRQLVSEAVAKAEQEAAEKLAAQEAENRRKLAEAELEAAKAMGEQQAAKLRADTEAMKAELDAQREAKAAQEAKDQLAREFEQDKTLIGQYLMAFTSEGRLLRHNGSGPASLSYLVGQGALQPTNKGVEKFLELGSYPSYNDRPRGGLPESFYFDNINVVDKNQKIGIAEKAQKLMIKYGELMVEKGMLDK